VAFNMAMVHARNLTLPRNKNKRQARWRDSRDDAKEEFLSQSHSDHRERIPMEGRPP
jgi:hypothetical protein